MTEDEIYARLTVIFRDVLDDESIVLRPETSAADVDGWDSFNHINLVVAAEAAFGVKFKSSELEQMGNVADMVTLILQKQSPS